jgi:hypothetical protein
MARNPAVLQAARFPWVVLAVGVLLGLLAPVTWWWLSMLGIRQDLSAVVLPQADRSPPSPPPEVPSIDYGLIALPAGLLLAALAFACVAWSIVQYERRKNAGAPVASWRSSTASADASGEQEQPR